MGDYYKPAEDADESEIESSRAPLLEHLIELRTRLLIACAAIVVAAMACYLFAKPLYEILQQPFRSAVEHVAGQHAVEAAHLKAADPNYRTVYAAAGKAALARTVFQYTHPFEVFFTYLKLALIAGLGLASPVIIWQVWGFVAPGLYRRERSAIAPFLVAAPVMFALGGLFVYYVALPFALYFALSLQQQDGPIPIQLIPKVNEYFGLVTTLILAFGACFQLPVILAVLARVGVIGAGFLRKGRRFAVVAIAVFAACFTPPDVVSMTVMAVPVYLLYEISIWVVWAIEKARLQSEAKLAEQAGLSAL